MRRSSSEIPAPGLRFFDARRAAVQISGSPEDEAPNELVQIAGSHRGEAPVHPSDQLLHDRELERIAECCSARDVRVSTLEKYVAALAFQLELKAVSPKKARSKATRPRRAKK